MEPQDDIRSKVKNSKKLDLTIIDAWSELVTAIPNHDCSYFDDSNFTNPASLLESHFNLEPYKGTECAYLEVWFLPAGEAKITLPFKGTEEFELEKAKKFFPHLVSYFNFEGTWEKVVEKLVEINNIVMQPAPPLKIKFVED